MPSGTYQKNSRDVLKREKEYYENNKERLEEQEINKYRELYNEEKNIKLEYIRNRYQNMSRALRDIVILFLFLFLSASTS